MKFFLSLVHIYIENFELKASVEQLASGRKLCSKVKSFFGVFLDFFLPFELWCWPIFMTKLDYGAEIWHHPGLARILHKKLKFASANALRLCAPGITAYSTHMEIHQLAERALPEKMCLYRHAVIMHKLFNRIICENEFLHLNFQLYDNERGQNLSQTSSLTQTHSLTSNRSTLGKTDTAAED